MYSLLVEKHLSIQPSTATWNCVVAGYYRSSPSKRTCMGLYSLFENSKGVGAYIFSRKLTLYIYILILASLHIADKVTNGGLNNNM